MSQAGLNRIWSQAILETLVKAKVKHICIAPGSRSTPLSLEALELSQRSDVQIHTHFDERGLGFLALGIAKASQQPVAVIVTSGTAVANLLPASAESGLTGEKLVLLTADRPASLVGVGANQAIVQKGIFSTHVRKSIELPSPNVQASLSESLTEINQGLAYQSIVGGAVHVNCPFPEPLYIQSQEEKQQYQPLFEQATNQLAEYQQLAKLYPSYNVSELTNGIQQQVINQLGSLKAVVIIGKMPLSDAQKVKDWAETLGWPVLADPQSGVSSDWAYFDLWLQHGDYFNALLQAQCILQFGGRLVSKRLAQWVKQAVSQHQAHYWLFEPNPSVLNPDRLPQLRTVAPIPASVELLKNHLVAKDVTTQGWADELKAAALVIKQSSLEVTEGATINECQLARHLPQLLASISDCELFVGNSLIVRLLDMLTQMPSINVHSNRGASGIDGLIATATGVQRTQQVPLVTLIGDTSLLYDVNSLALLTKVQHPHVVIVTNNDGGAIFDLLPVPELQKQSLYQMPHGYQFEYAAKQFGLHYINPNAWQACLDGILQYCAEFAEGKVQSALLVEITSPPEQASQHIKAIVHQSKLQVVKPNVV